MDVSIGGSVRIMRELQELSQNELAAITGIAKTAWHLLQPAGLAGLTRTLIIMDSE